jgi:hypothetical protein
MEDRSSNLTEPRVEIPAQRKNALGLRG